MLRDGISHARLMRESSDRLQLALRGEHPDEQHIASRILEDPTAWPRWENEHSGLMRQVSEHGRLRVQLGVLKQTAFRLIHRKALFEYLRDREVRGATRMQILKHFHPVRSYTQAVIAEHGVYLRSGCSYLCSSYIGAAVVQDPGFVDPMQCYEELYAEYFALYCSAHFAAGAEKSLSEAALLPLLKHQLDECRRAILDPGRELPHFSRWTLLRRRTGDTERLDVRKLRAGSWGF